MPRWIKREWLQARPRALLAITIGAALLALVVVVPLRSVQERAATRAWIAHKRGQVIYEQGAWERQNKRGRVEPSQDQGTIPLGRKLLGDEKAVLIAINDREFTVDEVARIKRVFPEAGIWHDESSR